MTDSSTHLSRSARVRQAERIAARVVNGRAVIIVVNAQQVHSLNPVGTHIWERADGRTMGDIADSLVDEFDVDAATAWADLCDFVESLRAVGALRLGET